MRGLNSETISICGGILGDFCEKKSKKQKALALKNFAWQSLLKLKIKNVVWRCASIKWRGCDNNCCAPALSVERLPAKLL